MKRWAGLLLVGLVLSVAILLAIIGERLSAAILSGWDVAQGEACCDE
jgi:hypothetical protein